MNQAIQMLASYPPSGKEKGYEAQPSVGVSAHYLHYDSDIHTPDPTNALRNCGSGTVIRRLLRSWPARPGKGKRGDFPRASD